MRLHKLWTAIVAAVAAIGLAGASAAPAGAEEGTATITGTVTLKGKRLAGQDIDVIAVDSAQRLSTQTDSEGAFAIEVPAGSYRILVSPPHVEFYDDDDADDHPNPYHEFEPGYEFFSTWAGNTTRTPDATTYSLASGETATVDIEPVPAGVITGRVVDAEGKPLSYARIRASNLTGTGDLVRNWSDADGRFKLVGFGTGQVRVSVEKRGVIVNVMADVVQGSPTKVKDVTIDRRRGTVTATFKRLKKGEKVVAYDLTSKVRREVAKAKKNGTLKVSVKLFPGRYRLEVQRLNLVTKVVRVRPGKKVDAGVKAAPSKRPRLTGILKGTDGKPLRDVKVSLSNRYGLSTKSLRTDSKGRYSFSNLGRGTYLLWARGSGANGAKSVKVKLKTGKTTKQNLKLPKTYEVTGTVVYQGKPVEGVSVLGYTFGDKIHVRTTKTDAQGRFTLKRMPRGTDRIHVKDNFAGGYLDRRVKVQVKQKDELVIKLKK